MHHAGSLGGQGGQAAACAEAQPVERGVAREAARWLVRLGSPRVTDKDVQACERWRAAKLEHEQAWQRAQQVNERFGLIPAQLGLATLNRPALQERRAALKTLIALIVAAPVGWTVWKGTPLRDMTADYRSAIGERRKVALADGSSLQLNTGAAVDVAYDEHVRFVRLRAGEIAVHTGADSITPARPFLVRTYQGSIATQFADFCVRQEDERCTVSVQSGEVLVQTQIEQGGQLRLRAGEALSFTRDALSAARDADPHAADWVRGVLYADGMSLKDFATALGRYRPGIVRCDPAVATLRLSGAFQLRDTDAVLDALPASLPVQVRYRTPYWVTIGPLEKGRA